MLLPPTRRSVLTQRILLPGIGCDAYQDSLQAQTIPLSPYPPPTCLLVLAQHVAAAALRKVAMLLPELCCYQAPARNDGRPGALRYGPTRFYAMS
eukprot:826501-Rhodomonas_salina.1